MRFIRLSDQQHPFSLGEVLATRPDVSFPSEASRIDFGALGFACISEGSPAPCGDCEETVPGPVELQGDQWVQTYLVRPLPDDVIAQNRAAAIDRAFNDVRNGVQTYLNVRAAERNYDSIQSAALRAAYPGPYREEGIAYGTWMDTCWAHCYAVLADVRANTRPIPTIEQLVAEFPELALPAR